VLGKCQPSQQLSDKGCEPFLHLMQSVAKGFYFQFFLKIIPLLKN